MRRSARKITRRWTPGVEELKLVAHVIWRGQFATENVEVKFLAVLTSAQSYVEALEPLLAVQNQAFLLVIVRHLERTQFVPMILLEVVYELPPANAHLRLPNQQSADGVLPKNGIE
jgi:hypothetical protein